MNEPVKVRCVFASGSFYYTYVKPDAKDVSIAKYIPGQGFGSTLMVWDGQELDESGCKVFREAARA